MSTHRRRGVNPRPIDCDAVREGGRTAREPEPRAVPARCRHGGRRVRGQRLEAGLGAWGSGVGYCGLNCSWREACLTRKTRTQDAGPISSKSRRYLHMGADAQPIPAFDMRNGRVCGEGSVDLRVSIAVESDRRRILAVWPRGTGSRSACAVRSSRPPGSLSHGGCIEVRVARIRAQVDATTRHARQAIQTAGRDVAPRRSGRRRRAARIGADFRGGQSRGPIAPTSAPPPPCRLASSRVRNAHSGCRIWRAMCGNGRAVRISRIPTMRLTIAPASTRMRCG